MDEALRTPCSAPGARLWSQIQGAGSDLVLLHGWGMHSGLWRPVLDGLAKRFRVTVVDLPGHGRSAWREDELTLPSMVDAVAEVAPPGSVWLGWSLGGMLALQAAARPSLSVRCLVTVGATPRFVRAPDWSCAQAPEVFEGFARDLTADYRATLQRFLALQCGGSERAREELRLMRGILFEVGTPERSALAAGLDILRRSDLRPSLFRVTCPALAIGGERDTLVPPSATDWLARALPKGRSALIEGAGHAPFLSHPDEFVEIVRDFLSHD